MGEAGRDGAGGCVCVCVTIASTKMEVGHHWQQGGDPERRICDLRWGNPCLLDKPLPAGSGAGSRAGGPGNS